MYKKIFYFGIFSYYHAAQQVLNNMEKKFTW